MIVRFSFTEAESLVRVPLFHVDHLFDDLFLLLVLIFDAVVAHLQREESVGVFFAAAVDGGEAAATDGLHHEVLSDFVDLLHWGEDVWYANG